MGSRSHTVVAPKTAAEIKRDLGRVLKTLEARGSSRVRDEMGSRFGIVTKDKVFGVQMGALKTLAKEIGCDHAMAEALWKSGCYEARMLATMVDEPARVTAAQMERWVKDCDNWAVVDTLCFNLFDRVPHAFAKIEAWHDAKAEFVKRAAFALIAVVSLHDKTAGDAAFMRCLTFIEKGARDERNFVKKGVSWALRGLGHRNAKLHTEALALAKRLSLSADATERWIGKDALKDLTRPAVAKRLAAKGKAKRKSNA